MRAEGSEKGGEGPKPNGFVTSSVGRLLRSTVSVLDHSLEAIDEADDLNVPTAAQAQEEGSEPEDNQKEDDVNDVYDQELARPSLVNRILLLFPVLVSPWLLRS